MATQCYEFVAYLSSLFSVSKQYNILYNISIIYIWGSYIIITYGLIQCKLMYSLFFSARPQQSFHVYNNLSTLPFSKLYYISLNRLFFSHPIPERYLNSNTMDLNHMSLSYFLWLKSQWQNGNSKIIHILSFASMELVCYSVLKAKATDICRFKLYL